MSPVAAYEKGLSAVTLRQLLKRVCGK